MSWKEMYRMMLRSGGLKGLDNAEKALEKLKDEAKEPWKKSIFSLLEDAVEEYGMDGLQKVEDAVACSIKGKNPDIGFASLKARSDFLAAMQNMEADDKAKMKDFFAKIGKAMGAIMKAIIAVMRGKDMPKWVKGKDGEKGWEKAKDIVRKEYGAGIEKSNPDKFFSLVTTVYKSICKSPDYDCRIGESLGELVKHLDDFVN